MNTDKATKSSWKIEPMPPQTAVLDCAEEFTPEEYEQIARGLIPFEMEDKWFMYLEGDTLYVHRSWTGFCIYQVTFESNGDAFAVSRVLVSRGSEQYEGDDDAYDVEMLRFLVHNLLLGKNEPFPVPKADPGGLYQHFIAGTSYPEVIVTRRRRRWWNFWRR